MDLDRQRTESYSVLRRVASPKSDRSFGQRDDAKVSFPLEHVSGSVVQSVEEYRLRVYGPYINRDQRRMVILIADDGKRTTKSYARYLMESSLGRELTRGEEVDHIDNNKLNDDLSNLQILSKSENARKSAPKAELITFNCLRCGREATRLARKVKANRRQGKQGPFCSRYCAGKYNSKTD